MVLPQEVVYVFENLTNLWVGGKRAVKKTRNQRESRGNVGSRPSMENGIHSNGLKRVVWKAEKVGKYGKSTI